MPIGIRELQRTAWGERVRGLVQEDPPPGILAYEDGVPAGWTTRSKG